MRSFVGFFWLHHAAHKILVPQPGIKPSPPALEAWGVNHWTNKEVPGCGSCLGLRRLPLSAQQNTSSPGASLP